MGNIKWFIPRKYFAISKPLSNREFQKLRQWLENREQIEIITDSKRRVWFANITKIEKYRNRRQERHEAEKAMD